MDRPAVDHAGEEPATESFALSFSRREFALVRQALTEYRDSPRRSRFEFACAARWLVQLAQLDRHGLPKARV